jgi:hypothetical protein
VQGERGWSGVAPIPPTWAARVPLTASPTALARQPLTLEARRVPRATPAEGAPEPGRVEGLSAVVVPPRIETGPPVELPEYIRSQPPLRHVSPRPIVQRVPLIEATSDFVGEPVAAHAGSGSGVVQQRAAPRFDREMQSTTEAGAQFLEALANLHKSGHARDEPGAKTPEAQEPSPTSRPPGALGAEPPRLTHRRTLAESRRLGLGAPLSQGALSQAADAAQDARPAGRQPTAADAPAPAASADAMPTSEPPTPPEPTGPPSPANEPISSDHPSAPRSAIPANEPFASDQPEASRPLPPANEQIASDEPEAPGPPGPRREPLRTTPVVRPVADPTVRLSARATPLVFRATQRPDTDRGAPEGGLRPPSGVVTRAPADLAQALRASHGIDVADVPVRRDPDAASQAGRLGTKAFTRAATVYLPEAAGPVSNPETRGLLAHELIHAAQQRALGSALPSEHSPEGLALEAQAIAAEHQYGGIRVESLRHAAQAVTPQWVEERLVQRQTPSTLVPSPGVSTDIEPLRHDIELVAEHTARHVVLEQLAQHQANAPSPTPTAEQSTTAPTTTPTPTTMTSQPAPQVVVNAQSSQSPWQNEDQREAAYLAALNARRVANGEATQLELSNAEREEMYQAWGGPGSAPGSGGMSGGGGGQPATPAPTLHWERGKGFVSSDPSQQQALDSQVQSAWGPAGSFGAALGATLLPSEFAARPGAPGTTGGTAPGTGVPGATGAVPGATGAAPGATGTTPRATGATAATTPVTMHWEHGRWVSSDQNAAQAQQQAMADAWGTSGSFGSWLGHHAMPSAFASGTAAAGAHAAAATPAGTAAPGTPATATGTPAHGTAPTAGVAPSGTAPATGAAAGMTATVGATGVQVSAGTHPEVDAYARDHEIDIHRLDMEALSKRLYDHLRSRLRQELLVDRERAGLLTDFR